MHASAEDRSTKPDERLRTLPQRDREGGQRMILKFRQSIGTDHGPYTAGKTYDVAEPFAIDWLRCGYAEPGDTSSATMQEVIAQMKAMRRSQKPPAVVDLDKIAAATLGRLDSAQGKTALFLPFLGEVGWLVMWHMRLVEFSTAARKIVCCHRGQECLFPSAAEFFYDWTNPIPDSLRAGTDRVERRWPRICDEFPHATPILAGGLSMEEELITVHIDRKIPITPRTRRGLKVDVCIGTRKREFLPAKNYPHWPRIAEALRAAGLTYAVIGSRESSYDLPGMTCMSADFGDWDAAVELLQNCRLFIGTDSGGAHLASIANGCPMIVQQVPDPHSGTTRCFIPRMVQTSSHQVVHLPPETWDQPEVMIDRTLEALQ
jgi:hypothetical protein